MIRARQAVAVLFVSLVGVWGCTRGTSITSLSDRVKALEAKNSRLESDFRAAAASRDQLRTMLTQSEEQLQKLQVVVKERDELKAQVKLKISERDQVAAQFDMFRKSLRDLVGQAESTALKSPDGDPVIVTIGGR